MMRKELIRGSIAVVVFTVMLGLVYPLVMTGISQVVLPGQADGSLIHRDGRVIGSTLLAQAWQRPVLGAAGKQVTAPDPRYFQPRPSATGYSASVTYFANRGPDQATTRALTRQHLAAYLALEEPYNPGLTAAGVPIDAATFSASGVDPDISKANAAIQARRIAAVRHLPLGRVRGLIAANTDGRGIGIFGEPGVNVTTLNHALDRAR
jgi:K+-transporting ATPase ATPase C chain